jgi:hypothetical protein
MRRRRRLELEFGLDSFLDVIANVIGVVIRLILVVWVAARSYESVKSLPPPPQPPPEATPAPTAPPFSNELARHRQELAEAEAILAEQFEQAERRRDQQGRRRADLTALGRRRRQLEQARQELEQHAREQERGRDAAAASLADFRERRARLTEEIRSLREQPAAKKALRYLTPVSKPVLAEELFFECAKGRVTFIDIAALLAEVKRGFDAKGDQLRRQWEAQETVGPVGAFRLRYRVERERGLLEGALGSAAPDPDAGFRASLTGWELEPVREARGEAAEAALAEDSEFRQVADRIDPRATTVTFWVYPDSFALFRRVRDYLYERGVVVAGRPLPFGAPIGASKAGSASRGQ